MSTAGKEIDDDPTRPAYYDTDRPDPRQIGIYRSMTPSQRLRQAMALNAQLRKFKRAALCRSHPDWTDAQVDEAVKEAFLYARD